MKRFFKKKPPLRLVPILFVFCVMLVSFAIIALISVILMRLGTYDIFALPNRVIPFIGMILASVIVGTSIAAGFSEKMLTPLRKIIDATQQVAAGDFTVQLDIESAPEIEILSESFNKMVNELASIETLRSDFTSNFSHEFKTPIVSVRGFAKLLRNKDLPDEERDEYIEIIIQESERLSNLATNVLELSKLENTGILTNKESFSLDEQIRRAAALMEPRWREKNVTVTLEMESIAICADEELLHRVWVNLIDNALKFAGDGGHISILLKKERNEAVFSITDDGCGMDGHTCKHLFDKFYQGDRSHSGDGNGLGMAIVKQIVTLSGGTIDVDSALGEGSAFTVKLPEG